MSLERVKIKARFLRNRWLCARLGLKNVHPTVTFGGGVRISPAVILGAYCFVAENCRISAGVTVGSYVMFAAGAAVVGDDHRIDVVGTPMIFSPRPEVRPTIIEDDVWLGRNALVMTGNTVGRGAVIAAGAVVTKDVPAYEIWAGVPAKKVRSRFADDEQKEHDAMLSGPPMRGESCLKR
ncbi:MAG: antibiotic acetyltransferase [Deltaproteobacteria bacterium]|nr:antibiotic acetyltransferase [Deltaproteobacteria bacterium]